MLLCRATYPGRSSLRDDPRGIFAGTLQSRDHTTLLVDRRTSPHSQLRMYLGRILRTEDSELNLSLSLSHYTQSVRQLQPARTLILNWRLLQHPFPF